MPGIGPVKGRYYFLDNDHVFWNHSMLGGFWWEGHPFQQGPFSTLDVPVPRWVNGAIPSGGTWPVIGPCGACEIAGLPWIFTDAILTIEFGPLGTVTLHPATVTGAPPNFSMRFNYGLCGHYDVNMIGTLCEAVQTGPQFPPTLPTLTIIIEDGVTDPNYLFTADWGVIPTACQFLFCGSVLGHYKVRFFGTLPP